MNVETILEFVWGPLGNVWEVGRTISFDLQEHPLRISVMSDHTVSRLIKGIETESSFTVEPSGCVLVRTAVEEDSIYGRGILAFAVSTWLLVPVVLAQADCSSSKKGQWASSNSITWKLLRPAESQTQGLLNLSLHFKHIPRWCASLCVHRCTSFQMHKATLQMLGRASGSTHMLSLLLERAGAGCFIQPPVRQWKERD